MDFILPRTDQTTIHLAAKMSSRERVVQAWAHQAVLDEAFPNQYTGVLAVASETKLGIENREVVEICVPNQWLAYQKFLANMHCILYLDPPRRILDLAIEHPGLINVRSFPNTPNGIVTALG